MRFSVLASGSTGNSIYVENDEHAFIVDAGLSGKRMEQLFAKIDRNMKQLSGIFVTHEHSDHIKGIGVLARKYNVPVYANAKTWQAMDGLVGDIPLEQRFEFEMDTVKHFGSIAIESFAVSHDAADQCSILFMKMGASLLLLRIQAMLATV